MILSGSDDKEIRSTAFSSLSSLSEYSSTYESVMQQIKRDIEVPRAGLDSGVQQRYFDFILSRIQKKKTDFEKIFKEDTIENRYSGFFCLLALAHDPNEKKIKNAVKSI